MNAKDLLKELRRVTFARFRVFNVKLFGNVRWGAYREFSADDVAALICDFGMRQSVVCESDVPEGEGVAPMSFKSGGNYAILSRLCEQYYVYEGSPNLQKKIVGEVEEIINELRNDDEAQREFELVLDANRDGVMSRFRRDYPALKEKDYKLYSYLAAGLSATTIAVLLGIEKSAVYNRVSRLKRFIKENKPA